MGNTGRSYLNASAKRNSKGLKVLLHEDEAKYTKKKFIHVYKGYDFLEDLLTVRTYIQKHYNIDFYTLELLLKLMGLKVFSRLDFSEIPRSFTFNRFNTMLESGYITIVADHPETEKRIYALNMKGKNIVTNFYKYLSGEKKIPESSTKNPMANTKKQVAFDKKKMALIKKLNQTPVPTHKEELFKNNS